MKHHSEGRWLRLSAADGSLEQPSGSSVGYTNFAGSRFAESSSASLRFHGLSSRPPSTQRSPGSFAPFFWFLWLSDFVTWTAHLVFNHYLGIFKCSCTRLCYCAWPAALDLLVVLGFLGLILGCQICICCFGGSRQAFARCWCCSVAMTSYLRSAQAWSSDNSYFDLCVQPRFHPQFFFHLDFPSFQARNVDQELLDNPVQHT